MTRRSGGGHARRSELAGAKRPSQRRREKAFPVLVLRDERCVRRVADIEAAVSFIADRTGKHPEFIFDELRHNRAVMQDDGDQTAWFAEDRTNYGGQP